MNPQNSFTFTLSHDEFAWLLTHLGSPLPLGMGDRVFPPSVDQATAEIRLQAGGMALLARGFVSITPDNKYGIDSLLMGTIGAIALSHRAALVTTTYIQNNETQILRRGYYIGQNLMVEHRLPTQGLHQFTVTNRSEELLDLLMNALEIQDKQPLPIASFQASIPVRPLLEAIEANDGQAAYRLLREQNVDDATSKTTVLTMLKAGIRATVLVIGRSADAPQTPINAIAGLRVYHGEQGTLALTTDGQDDGKAVSFFPYSEANARVDLAQLLIGVTT